jgi:molybdopterin converting factor small subunit
MLASAANTELRHQVAGSEVSDVFSDLFKAKPGLRNHILDENGEIRPHVSVFVDGVQADLASPVEENSEIRILHAVSGGSSTGA